jgi:Ni/Fe-hydrogenase subunit HybB-like protein
MKETQVIKAVLVYDVDEPRWWTSHEIHPMFVFNALFSGPRVNGLEYLF